MGSVALRAAAATAVAVAVAAAFGCGSAETKTTHRTAASATFRNQYVAFDYPAAWTPFVFKITGTLHFNPMLYLSSQPAHTPCRKHDSETVCGWPVDRLREGGTLIMWENRDWPGWALDREPGAALTVGGRRAKRTVGRPGRCSTIGADETIQIEIEQPNPASWTAVTACLKGPGLRARERQFDALLASTRFVHS